MSNPTFYLQNVALREPGNTATDGNAKQNPGCRSILAHKALDELIAVDLAGRETFPLLGFGLEVVWVGDFAKAQSKHFGASESEDFAESGVRVRYPSISIEDRHSARCVLERSSDEPLV